MNNWTVVVDKLDSAIGIAARNRFSDSLENVIAAESSVTFNHLLTRLIHSESEYVLFAWRGALQGVWSSTTSLELFKELKEAKKVFACVVDHVGLENIDLEERIISLIDGYFVSSEELRVLYQSSFPSEPPIGILRDMPNYAAIERIRRTPKNQDRQVIWVGNSQWGSRSGHYDHKGFNEIVKPLFHLLNTKYNIQTTVVDSNVKRLENVETLELIHKSSVLIQASRSEGTGLPVLEALGLNTAILTTNVGIVAQLQLSRSNFFARTDEIEDIANKVLKLMDEDCNTEGQFDEYVASAKLDFCLDNSLERKALVEHAVAIRKASFYWNIKWVRRWFLYSCSLLRIKVRGYFKK